MRNLRTNPRKFTEPFILKKIEVDYSSGIEKITFLPTILFYGSILTNSNFEANSSGAFETFDLSIKIPKTGIKIKPKDRIIFNEQEFIVVSISKDKYSFNEVVIKCNFEKEQDNRDPFAYDLEAVIYG